ncbi:MAG: hypothetical protein HY863_21180 [Chloroflexi bacterium]|nr:hypothetical protein [Chloroflexota bacterium]
MLLIDELRAAAHVHYSNSDLEVSEAGQEWLRNLNKLCEQILQNDPRMFLQWDVIKNTMFVSDAPYLSTELHFIKNMPNWKDRWKKAVKESPAGCPTHYWGYRQSSGNLIHHAYHIARFEEITGVSVDKLDRVFEFGGGYGSLCRLFYNLGFTGNYIIYDLPLISALQKFYLKSMGLNVLEQQAPDNNIDGNGVLCLSETNTLLEKINFSDNKSLFIATWSISEIPVSLRQPVLNMAEGIGAFLFAYQHQFGEVNNVEYFSKMRDQIHQKIEWHSSPITHIPGSYYLIGKPQ